MVFGSMMLEIAIGIIFVYLLMSLLCSAVAEFFESLRKYRAQALADGILKLLGNPDLTKQFFEHSMIKPLFEGRKPSYIPARTFSLALWNMATAAAQKTPEAVAGLTRDLGLLRSTIASLPPETLPEKLKGTLVALIDEANGDFDKARANVERWYDDSMDRVSGKFKRRTHWMLIGIGFVLAVMMNVDSINIVKVLSHSSELRESIVAAAENYAKAPLPGTTPTPTPAATPTPAPASAAAAGATPGAAATSASTPASSPTAEPATSPSATPTPTVEELFAATSERINNIRAKLNESRLPIGWVFEPDKTDKKYYKDAEKKQFDQALYDTDVKAYRADPRRTPDGGEFPTKFLGLLLTAFAVSQGAPFWFDLLNKIIVIRSTVKPHEKSPEQPSKDRPAPDAPPEPDEDEEEPKG
jgi:cell division septation protein DedD